VIACLCHGVSEHMIHAIIARGARTVSDIKQACGAGGDCGSCRSVLAALVAQAEGPPCGDANESRYARGGSQR
jgi:bacterioferritin-associated ferredoxin